MATDYTTAKKPKKKKPKRKMPGRPTRKSRK